MRFRSSARVWPAALRKQGYPYWKQAVVSGLFTGLAPLAPGTAGSAVACLLYFVPGCHYWPILLGMSVVAFAAGIPLASQAEKFLGNDPGFVTLDEFAGQWLALASPLVFYNPWWALLCFLLFRFFDIVKIYPASRFDRTPGGVGVMADDMVAGLYANICAHLLWMALAWAGPVWAFLHRS